MSIFGICFILYFNHTCSRTVCTFIAEIDSMCSSDLLILLSQAPPRRRHVNCIKTVLETPVIRIRSTHPSCRQQKQRKVEGTRNNS